LLTYWAVNAVLIAAVVVMTAGADALRSFLKDREGLVVDVVAGCLGTLAAVLWATEPMLAVLLLPPVLLLEHQLFSGLRQAVRTDLLTDVANPQYWREVAGREVERAAASDDHLAILMIDVDHFKAVNDKYGHLAGDEVLAAVARTIAQALRPRDLVGRLGGEEFGAVLSGLNLLDAEGAAERLRTQVRDIRVRADSGEWINVTVSVGVSELSVTGGDLHQLLDAADTALYAAKAAGRDCVRVAAAERGVVIDLSAQASSSVEP
jgi:diguanylate cyclase (GGDEF)-like protein